MLDEPLLFLKAPSAIIASGDDIVLPGASQQVEHEGELGVVIGRVARNIPSEEDPLSYVLGYTCVNDVTAAISSAKTCSSLAANRLTRSAPSVRGLKRISIRECHGPDPRVNGEVKQKGNTADMAFPVAFLIRYISEIMTLYPGDLIATGTPAGVSRLKPGDIVEVEVAGIGVLRNQVVSADR